MRVFKYKGGNFERDMNSLEKISIGPLNLRI